VRATVVIVTKNRKDELQRALDSCLAQTAVPAILVIDDGSVDGTAASVKANYPTVQLVRSEVSRGLIFQRNYAAQIVGTEVIVSLDDDAAFSEPTIIAAILHQFTHDRIAAIAIPFVNVRSDPKLRQSAPDTGAVWVTNEFIGTAYAIKADVFQGVGGFREFFFHQEEEGDLCIRLLEHGYVVRVGSSAPIHHFESPQRSFKRMNVYGQRNLMLFTWLNVPCPELIFHFPATVLNGLLWGIKRGFFLFRLKGTVAGVRAMLTYRRDRQPVQRKTYWLYRRLKKGGPLTVESL
jgi:GT2 family glycosyltransferase